MEYKLPPLPYRAASYDKDAGLSDEQLAGKSLHFVLGRVAKAVGTKGCS